MKSKFMSLTLFILTGPVLTGPVLAEPMLTEPSDDHGTFQEMHRIYPDVFENTRSKPDPAYDDEPRYLKLIQPLKEHQQIKTIKANLTVRGIMKQTV